MIFIPAAAATSRSVVRPLISCNTETADRRRRAKREVKTTRFAVGERRELLLLLPAILVSVADSRTDLLNKYLKKSEENKAKNDKERLDSYYKRNYRDYFGLLEGGLEQKEENQLSESEKAILEWLQTNK